MPAPGVRSVPGPRVASREGPSAPYARTLGIVLVVALAVAFGPSPAAGEDAGENPVLGELSDPSSWTFEKARGEGTIRFVATPEGAVAELAATGAEGMAASLRSRRFPVEPNRRYTITMD